MDEMEQDRGAFRAEIASRNRHWNAQARERKLTMAVFGLLAYSSFANFLGAVLTFSSSSIDAGIALVLGGLYALGAYRVWAKDDTRWWPVAIPASISVGLMLLVALAGVYRPLPLLLNLVLLVLVPIRAKAVAAAVPNYSFNATGQS